MKNKLIGLLIAFLTFPLFAQYELTILDSGPEATAYDVNEHGWACGYRKDDVTGVPTPVIWSPEGQYIDLPTLPWVTRQGIAFTINDRFEVGGVHGTNWSTGTHFYKMAYGISTFWVFDPDAEDFSAFKIAENGSTIRGINNWSELAGKDQSYGYVWNPFELYGYDNPKYGTDYNTINDDGDAAGTDGASPLFSERQSDGSYVSVTLTHIGTQRLGGYGTATSVNIHDEVVGADHVTGGFVWDPHAPSGTAGTLFGVGTHCFANNDAGVIVGAKDIKACVWRKSGTTYVRTELDTFDDAYVLELALGMNNKGHIVGRARHAITGAKVAFLLTPKHDMRPSIQVIGTSVKLSWHTQEGMDYMIETSTDLTGWAELPTIYTGDGNIKTVTLPKGGPARFFRIVEVTN